jgi:hypothetical protein
MLADVSEQGAAARWQTPSRSRSIAALSGESRVQPHARSTP